MRNIDTIVQDFFDLEKPCPSEIIECEQIRQRYKSELDTISAQGCTQCQKNSLKGKYMEDVWKKAIESLTKK